MKNCIKYILFVLLLTNISCKKLVNIDPPSNQLTPDKVFDNVSSVNSATANIYTVLGSVDSQFLTFIGVYTDELLTKNVDATNAEFTNSALTTANSNVLNIWRYLYSTIYKANAVIEGLPNSVNVSDSVKNQCMGEAKFMRAYSHFMLTNIYGDVPLVTTTNATINASASPAAKTIVYQQIIEDLKDASMLLGINYPSSGEKVRANKWAACALLAKVYLYTKDYNNAQIQASSVINSGKYALNALSGVFLANSSESILQNWNVNGYVGLGLIPSSGQPTWPVNTPLLNSFESGDNRKSTWLKTIVVSGTNYYYPYKYKQTAITTGVNAEYIMYLRLADMYLIRAEALAQLNQLTAASDDLNKIRSRAGLGGVSTTVQLTLLSAIAHERQVEFFMEAGNRFFDLKRSASITTVLAPIKPLWIPTAEVFPIPFAEILADHNLIQNPGYVN